MRTASNALVQETNKSTSSSSFIRRRRAKRNFLTPSKGKVQAHRTGPNAISAMHSENRKTILNKTYLSLELLVFASAVADTAESAAASSSSANNPDSMIKSNATILYRRGSFCIDVCMLAACKQAHVRLRENEENEGKRAVHGFHNAKEEAAELYGSAIDVVSEIAARKRGEETLTVSESSKGHSTAVDRCCYALTS